MCGRVVNFTKLMLTSTQVEDVVEVGVELGNMYENNCSKHINIRLNTESLENILEMVYFSFSFMDTSF